MRVKWRCNDTRTLSVIVFVSAMGLSYWGPVDFPTVDVRWERSTGEGPNYSRGARSDSGPEVVFVFITSSTCGPSNEPGLQDSVVRLKLAVRDYAARLGYGFSAVGVAKDRDVDAGLEHLEGFGTFDEVTAGRGWLNGGILRFVYGDVPGPAATPQVLVVERYVEVDGGERLIRTERLVGRRVGVTEIGRWSRAFKKAAGGVAVKGRAEQKGA